MGYGEATDATEVVSMEEVALMEEDVLDIRIAPTTSVMVLTSKRYFSVF